MNPSDPNRMRELGRRGGLASAAARRKRRDRAWFDTYLESVDAAPAEFAAGLLASGNAMAKVKALELAQTAKRERLRAREAELDKREAEVSKRERTAESTAQWLEVTRREYERVTAEVDELKILRDELRVAIAREADAHDFELREDEDALVQA